MRAGTSMKRLHADECTVRAVRPRIEQAIPTLRGVGGQQNHQLNGSSVHTQLQTLSSHFYNRSDSDLTLSCAPRIPTAGQQFEDIQEPEVQNSVIAYQNKDGSGDKMCFGMFQITQIKFCGEIHSLCRETFTEATLKHNNILVKGDAGASETPMIGKVLCDRSLEVLSRLRNVKDITLEIYCHKLRDPRPRTKRNKGEPFILSLLVNLYGAQRLHDTIGHFFTRVRINLRDPVVCGQDVPYLNPHMLPSESCVPNLTTTSSFRHGSASEDFTAPTDFLDEIMQIEDNPEADQPRFIRTKLHTHQKQALYFMQRREIGYSIDPSTGQAQFTLSTFQKDDLVRGGLIADQMGLGKTLQMIALVATDVDNFKPSASMEVGATLIVVPPSLLQTWKEQMVAHMVENAFALQTFYGTNRTLDLDSLSRPGAVLTTYQTVVSDFRKGSMFNKGRSISGVRWRRIILDEAHVIRNPHSLMSQAVCSLHARYRWAVTGTPIQNRLVDLFSLLRFIRASPFDDLHRFETSITKPWGASLDVSAVALLKGIVQSIAIRRTKASVNLPHREDRIRKISFNRRERSYYEAMRSRIRQDASIREDDTEGFSNVLRWIDSLRQVCSRGVSEECKSERNDMEQDYLATKFGEHEEMDIPFETHPSVEYESCSHNRFLGRASMDDPPEFDDFEAEAEISTPLEDMDTDGSSGNLHMQSQSIDCFSASQSPYPEEYLPHESTKIQALVTDIIAHNGKSIVFSFWRSTLSAVSEVLANAGISHLNLDGSRSVAQRDAVIGDFRRDISIKVLLATISAGGVGLDLTVANQVCLVEPQWNPTVEEQAFSRVHRMNQTKPVTTIRYVLEDSIEENVSELQSRKRKLLSLAFSENGGQMGKRLLQDLKLLL